MRQELAARISLSADSTADVPSRSMVGHRSVSRAQRPRRLKGGADSSMQSESGFSASFGSVHCTGVNGSCASSYCGAGRQASSNSSAVVGISDSPASPAACRLDTSGKRTYVFQWTRCQCRHRVLI